MLKIYTPPPAKKKNKKNNTTFKNTNKLNATSINKVGPSMF